MKAMYWQKQGSKPLFPDLEWSKPERRDQAGRLLIIGGSAHALSAPAKSFEIAKQTGIGNAKIILPDKTKRFIEDLMPEASFLPSTKTGEFSQEGRDLLLEEALWSDSTLLPGDLGRNSQTTILLEALLNSYTGQVIVVRDTLDILANHPQMLLERPQTTIISTFAQLQKLLQNFGSIHPLVFSMDLLKLVEHLHLLTQQFPSEIVVLHNGQLVVAAHGRVSTTKINDYHSNLRWRTELASIAACYRTWNPHSAFESLTTAAHVFTNDHLEKRGL